MKERVYRHIIWDWNGTLLDDAWLCVEVINQLLRERALPPVSLDSYRAQFDFPVILYYERIGLPTDPEAFCTISQQFIDRYHERFEACSLRPGVSSTLEAIHRQGRPMSILSASRQDFLERAVRMFGVEPWFDSLNGIDTIHATGKLERGRKCIEALGIPPTDCLLVGDTVHDFEVASTLGLQCILLANGHHDAARLRATGMPVLESVSDLAQVLQVS